MARLNIVGRLAAFGCGLVLLSFLGVSMLRAAESNAPAGVQPVEETRSIELGFEEGEPGKQPEQWFVPTPGWEAKLTDSKAADGKRSVRLSKPGESDAPFGNVMRHLGGKEFRGLRVKLTARVEVEEGEGWCQMWMRVDRSNDQTGSFDNMGDRPIRRSGWKDASIEFDVDSDAASIALGFIAFNGATVLVDSVKLTVIGKSTVQEATAATALSARGLENVRAASKLFSYVRFFHPSDQAISVVSWDHVAVRLMEEAEGAKDAKELAERLQGVLAPIAPSMEVWAGDPAAAAALPDVPDGATTLVHWVHHGAGTIAENSGQNIYSSKVEKEDLSGAIDAKADAKRFVVRSLGGGVSVRLAIRVYADKDGTLPHAAKDTPWSSLRGLPRLVTENRWTRMAGVAMLWGTMQHFYPYFDVVETDWEAALGTALDDSAQDADESAYLGTLRELVAKLHDGHGNVYNPSIRVKSRLPVSLAWAGTDLVVSGKHEGVGEDVRIGDTVLAIGGKPLEECLGELSRSISAATDGWLRYRELGDLVMRYKTEQEVKVRLRGVDGSEREVVLTRVAPTEIVDVTAKRPANGTEVAPGIVYFDLNGAQTEAMDAKMDALRNAKGIIFDMRGYPGSAGYDLLRHLIDEPVTSAFWNVPNVTGPDHEGWEIQTAGRWNVEPSSPRLRGQIAFLTDGRAISYAESVMGIVEAYKMGEIVGATTAGTNGNVNPFVLPGGYNVSWTGMQVIKHDGSRHHGVGIRPTVAVEPTAKGIAEGRDEVLEKGIEVIQHKLGTTAVEVAK